MYVQRLRLLKGLVFTALVMNIAVVESAMAGTFCEMLRKSLIRGSRSSAQVLLLLVNPKRCSDLPEAVHIDGGSGKMVRRLIRSGCDINSADTDGRTALMLAVEYGYDDLTAFLIHNGADLNLQDRYGKSALMYAAKSRSLLLVSLLINHGATLNLRDHDGWSALDFAIEQGHFGVVYHLVKSGAKDDDGRALASELSKVEPSQEIANLLIQNGSGLAGRIHGEPLLCRCVMNRWTSTAIALLDRGVDPNEKCEAYRAPGTPPLHYVVYYDDHALADRMIKFGARVDEKDPDGATPLMSARNLRMVNALIASGANISVRDSSGHTILHYPQFVGDQEMMRFAIEHGVDINDNLNLNRVTPLLQLWSKNHPYPYQLTIEKVRRLIEQGADVNLRDINGKSALQFAYNYDTDEYGHCRLGWPYPERCNLEWEIVKLLIQTGADPYVVTSKGGARIFNWIIRRYEFGKWVHPDELKTPIRDYRNLLGQNHLMIAVLHGDAAAVEGLLEIGFYMGWKDNLGMTAMDYAIEKGDQKIIRLLQGH